MNYTDFAFLPFFACTLVAYYLASSVRWQTGVLIVASLAFYAWTSAELLAVFLLSWLITSTSSYLVASHRHAAHRKLFAWVGVAANLFILGFFKYRVLLTGPVSLVPSSGVNSLAHWLLASPLPIGISFYTFHGMSLLVDTYRGTAPVFQGGLGTPLRHGSRTLLYLVFFPQLVAGPIIKARDFYPQIEAKRIRDIDLPGCFRLLVLGYFLKSVVADNLSEQTFWLAYPYFQWRTSGDLVLLLYGYSAQIFADFAGYSLIALGLAKLLGYRLPENFNFPYLASSISDFWRRWHMSLSSWLRDYLYIPLGGNRHGTVRTYGNLFVVMLLGGLWHGAAWSFAIWGAWHGIGLMIERRFRDSWVLTTSNRVVSIARVIAVFNFVTLGWLLFKLQDYRQAWLYLKTIIHSSAGGFATFTVPAYALLILLYSACVAGYHLVGVHGTGLSRRFKDACYGGMLFLLLTNRGPAHPFIYFQF